MCRLATQIRPGAGTRSYPHTSITHRHDWLQACMYDTCPLQVTHISGCARIIHHRDYDVRSYSPPRAPLRLELIPSLSDHWKLVPFLTLSAACVTSRVVVCRARLKALKPGKPDPKSPSPALGDGFGGPTVGLKILQA